MFVALFHIVEPATGPVRLGGVDIRTIGLRDLRSKMAMIPQDPFMFAGTIRSNLDPFDEHRDDAVWEVLDKVGFDRRWRRTPSADAEVTDNAPTFARSETTSLHGSRVVTSKSRAHDGRGDGIRTWTTR